MREFRLGFSNPLAKSSEDKRGGKKLAGRAAAPIPLPPPQLLADLQERRGDEAGLVIRAAQLEGLLASGKARDAPEAARKAGLASRGTKDASCLATPARLAAIMPGQ